MNMRALFGLTERPRPNLAEAERILLEVQAGLPRLRAAGRAARAERVRRRATVSPAPIACATRPAPAPRPAVAAVAPERFQDLVGELVSQGVTRVQAEHRVAREHPGAWDRFKAERRARPPRREVRAPAAVDPFTQRVGELVAQGVERFEAERQVAREHPAAYEAWRASRSSTKRRR